MTYQHSERDGKPRSVPSATQEYQEETEPPSSTADDANGSAVQPIDPQATSLAPRPEEARFAPVQLLRSWLRSTMNSKGRESLKEALEEIIEEHEEDAPSLNPEERLMLENILQFGELDVQDVMVPRSDIVAVPIDVSLDHLRQQIIDKGHTRMPVYNGKLDDVVGFIHIKDLIPYLGEGNGFSLETIVRPLVVVPPSMKIVDLLVRMRSEGVHMALVVDEYGGTDGIVTLEDLFEKIVGDIQDEHDETIKIPLFREISKNVAVVDARIDLQVLEDHLGVSFQPEEDDSFHTLGGLIFTLLGHVPAKGEKITHNGLIFDIIEADPRRIHRVRILRGK